MKRLAATLALVAAACSDTTNNPVTQLNLDRPVDISFSCYGGLRLTNGSEASPDQQVVSSAQPIESCTIWSGAHATDQPAPRPPGQDDLGTSIVTAPSWYAFILESGPGTVALARFDTKPASGFGGGDVTVLDTDSLTPGKNGITVGEDPVAIATDRVGCYEVIANAGSCDLSVLDINSVFTNGEGVDPVVNRMAVTSASGEPIKARPAAMAFEPPGGAIGAACPATATGLAYIAYPSCHKVLGVDVSTGTVVTSLNFADDGSVTVGDGNVSCPNECDAPTMLMPGVRPVALKLELDPRTSRRLLSIGADNSNVLTVYDLDAASMPLTATQVALENTNGTIGIVATAISPVIGMGGDSGLVNDDFANAGQHQFVYGVATDGTVRVIDLFGVPHECDTQIDPRFLHDLKDVDKLACLPIGDPTLPRRADVKGPGIELTPVSSSSPQDALATSIDIFRVEPIDGDSRKPGDPSRLIGYFGVITASSGRTYVVNIDDDDYADYYDATNPLGTQPPLTLPHQLRDALGNRGQLAQVSTDNGPKFVCDDPGPDPDALGANTAGPRQLGSIQRTVPANTLSSSKWGGLPSIRQVLCESGVTPEDNRPVSELYFGAPVDVRAAVFPDLRALRADETWSLTWEGPLSLDSVTSSIDGPQIRESQMFVDGAGFRIVDDSKPFCDAGVEPYDIVQLRGCDPSIGDLGCPLGYTCYVHPQSQVTGLGACMLTNEAERLATACKAFLTSLRRYTVARSTTGELQLLPRKRVLRTTPVTGCTSNEQCTSLATYADAGASSLNPIDDETPTNTQAWECKVDPDRKQELDPDGQPLKRCLLACNDLENSTDCDPGTVCTANPEAAPAAGYCMEGVTPPQSCVNAAQRYELRAGEAFTVIGSRTGYLHSVIADDNGQCVKDPDASPLLVGRIPLRAPACDPTADPLTGRLPDGTFGPNPCETTVDETEYQLNYVEGTCTLDNPDESLVTRPADAIVLRNRALNLTLVDPTYQGDLQCHGDRAGMLEDVPLVAPGYQIAFRQTAGFVPLTVSSIAPSFPIKVTRGPTESIWVIDEGDYLSTSISTPSTRGKVYRVESRALGIINLLQ